MAATLAPHDLSRTSTLSVGLVIAAAYACGPSTSNNPDSVLVDSGGDSPVNNGPWTQVTPKNGASLQATTVSGFWFESQTSGVVSFAEGLVEHFNAPTTIDSVSLDGSGKLPGSSDDAYFGFLPGTSLGSSSATRPPRASSQAPTRASRSSTPTCTRPSPARRPPSLPTFRSSGSERTTRTFGTSRSRPAPVGTCTRRRPRLARRRR